MKYTTSHLLDGLANFKKYDYESVAKASKKE